MEKKIKKSNKNNFFKKLTFPEKYTKQLPK